MTRARLDGRLLLLAAVLLALPTAAMAQTGTRYVNATDATCGGHAPCYTTIQAAVTAALPGEAILIQAGTYIEQVQITGKNNTPSAIKTDRITLAADPTAPVGGVTLRGSATQCTNGYAIRLQQSK